MQIFLDTVDLEEVKELCETGLIDGVTTNPSLASKSGVPFPEIIKQLSQMVSGPISAEVTALDTKRMIEQGLELAKMAENIAVKVPLTMEGLMACRALSGEGIMVNVTLCFSVAQALLAAKSGATMVSPFVGRLDDIGHDGMDLIAEIASLYHQQGYDTEVLAASIRHPLHVPQAARAGADIITMPPKIFRQLYRHPLTDIGLENFLTDWQNSGQTL